MQLRHDLDVEKMLLSDDLDGPDNYNDFGDHPLLMAVRPLDLNSYWHVVDSKTQHYSRTVRLVQKQQRQQLQIGGPDRLRQHCRKPLLYSVTHYLCATLNSLSELLFPLSEHQIYFD